MSNVTLGTPDSNTGLQSGTKHQQIGQYLYPKHPTDTQWPAVCCSVLQCDAVWCRCCSQYISIRHIPQTPNIQLVCRSVLQCVAVCCSVLPCGAGVAASISLSDTSHRHPIASWCVAVCCSVLPCDAVWCWCCSQYISIQHIPDTE